MQAKWMKNLNKSELKHLSFGSATGKPSLRSLRSNLLMQHKEGIRCFVCEDIARKLCLNVEEK